MKCNLHSLNLIVNKAYVRYSDSNLVVEHNNLPKFVTVVHGGFDSYETARTW